MRQETEKGPSLRSARRASKRLNAPPRSDRLSVYSLLLLSSAILVRSSLSLPRLGQTGSFLQGLWRIGGRSNDWKPSSNTPQVLLRLSLVNIIEFGTAETAGGRRRARARTLRPPLDESKNACPQRVVLYRYFTSHHSNTSSMVNSGRSFTLSPFSTRFMLQDPRCLRQCYRAPE